MNWINDWFAYHNVYYSRLIIFAKILFFVDCNIFLRLCMFLNTYSYFSSILLIYSKFQLFASPSYFLMTIRVMFSIMKFFFSYKSIQKSRKKQHFLTIFQMMSSSFCQFDVIYKRKFFLIALFNFSFFMSISI